jgi:hypothetical protein
MIAVVVSAAAADRVSEGLRAALGLGLRGDPVEVALVGPAARYAGEGGGDGDPRIARALATLARLGRPARVVDAAGAVALARRAQAVEVWTDGRDPAPPARTLELVPAGGGEPAVVAVSPREVDPGSIIDRVLAAERAVIW